MFLSRTVAAEVCMECRSNETGYLALKGLEALDELRFSLKDLINDLLQVSVFIPVLILSSRLHL